MAVKGGAIHFDGGCVPPVVIECVDYRGVDPRTGFVGRLDQPVMRRVGVEEGGGLVKRSCLGRLLPRRCAPKDEPGPGVLLEPHGEVCTPEVVVEIEMHTPHERGTSVVEVQQ